MNYLPACVPGFLAFKFPFLQYIIHIFLQSVSSGSSYRTYLPVEVSPGTLLACWITSTSMVALQCPPCWPRYTSSPISSVSCLTTAQRPECSFLSHTPLCPSFHLFTVSPGCPRIPNPVGFMSSSCRNAHCQGLEQRVGWPSSVSTDCSPEESVAMQSEGICGT